MPSARDYRRSVVRCALLLLVAAGLLTSLSQQRPWQVLGDSMAPALLGPCFDVRCTDCGCRFPVSIAAAADTAVCPNCGLPEIPVAGARLREGARVALRPATELERLDLAAYVTPAGKRMVKRVVGRPGEQLEVRQGDLWIDGRRLRKSLAELRRMAILVHDSRHVSAELGPRWHGEQGRWIRHPSGLWRLRSAGRARLAYAHRVSYEGRRPRNERDLVRDHYSVNATLSRSLNVVNDQLLEVRLRAAGGAIRLVFDNGQREWGARWNLEDGTLRLIGESASTPAAADRWTTLHVGCFDRQQLIAVDGRVLLSGPGPRPGPGSPLPWRIDSQDAKIDIRRLRIWRDVYYDVPYGGPRRWQLSDQQWLLLGDNVPASWDSRQTGPVEHNWLLGRVLP